MAVTVKDIYDRTKELSDDERVELVTLLLDDVAPDPPNTFRTHEEFAELVREGLSKSSAEAIGDEYWQSLDLRIQARAARKQ